MTSFRMVWGGLLTAGVFIETVALATRSEGKSGTFTAFCRWLAGTHAKPGHWRQYPFGAALAALLGWFWGHVLLRWGPN